MNPFARPFSNPVDIAVAWVGVVLCLLLFATVAHKRFPQVSTKSEQWFSGIAAGLMAFLALIVAVFIGLIFLEWLRIQSPFWSFWGLLFPMSVICLFRVLPIFAVVLLGWAVAGRWKSHYSRRSLFLALFCLLMVVIDGGLYFCMNYPRKPPYRIEIKI
jgi:hypothetical protein